MKRKRKWGEKGGKRRGSGREERGKGEGGRERRTREERTEGGRGEGKEKVERMLKEMSRRGYGRGGKSGPWFSLHSLHLGREPQIQEPLPTPEMSQKYHQSIS